MVTKYERVKVANHIARKSRARNLWKFQSEKAIEYIWSGPRHVGV